MLVALTALAVFRIESVQQVILRFPETMCFVAAALILIGRCTLNPSEREPATSAKTDTDETVLG
jgi:hypothetical protein